MKILKIERLHEKADTVTIYLDKERFLIRVDDIISLVEMEGYSTDVFLVAIKRIPILFRSSAVPVGAKTKVIFRSYSDREVVT